MIEVGKTYDIKTTRYGSKFKVKKINEKGIVCGYYMTPDNKYKQGACIKDVEFLKLITNA